MAGKYERKKKNWFARHKILTAIVLILLLLVLLVVGFVWSKLRLIQYVPDSTKPQETVAVPKETSEAETVPPEATEEEADQIIDISGLEISETEPPIPQTQVEEKEEVVNILLLGTDERAVNFSENARSDSMILMSINKDRKTVKLVSLERGMGVPVLSGPYEGQWDWLTHIFRYGGADLLVETVEHCFKVEVDHYVRVNFTSVMKAVDTIGGIEMELTAAEASALNRGNSWNLHGGVNHLNGEQALLFARLRSIDSDWQRVQRQRKVIIAAVEALKGSSLKELNQLLDQVLPLIQTNMTMLDIADLMLYSPNFFSSAFDQMTIPQQGTYGGMTGMEGRNLFAVDFEVNSQILKDFLYGEEEQQ